MVGIGHRTIKMALGAGLAIWIASLFGLEFATFSAIIAIICIEDSKKKTLMTIREKFFASLLSLFLGALFLEILGYHPITFALFSLLFFPLLVRLRIQGGFLMSIVVLLHVYALEKASVDVFLNELYLIFIGMGIALLTNSIMPNLQPEINNFKQDIEAHFKVILHEFAAYLRDSKRNWDGTEIVEVETLIEEAKSIAILDVENHLLRKEDKDYYYLEMREDQVELLKQMMQAVALAASSEIPLTQKIMLADFLDYLSENVDATDTTADSFHKLQTCMATIRKSKLPTTREEFEVRANLFYLFFEIENYLKVKRKLFAKWKK